jgi:PAS domain S-box-containing protein
VSGRSEPSAAVAAADSSANAVVLTDAAVRRMVDSLADAVVVADAAGIIVFWNAAATRVFGWPASDALGQSLDLIIPERFRARHWAGYRQTMATGHTDYGERLLEVPAVHRDGRTLSIAFTVTLLRDDERRPAAIAAVVRDDTERWQERRRLEAEIAALAESRGP